MKLHLIALPHTATVNHGFDQCAFTRKCRDFPGMMKKYGYETLVYGSDVNDSEAELVTCITTKEQEYYLQDFDWYRDGKYYNIPFDERLPIWKIFIKNVIKKLVNNLSVGDLILISSPIYYKPLSRAFPNYKIIEYGVGYPTILSPFRVFESVAWRNYSYGSNQLPDHTYLNDAVIPNYYDPNNFPLHTDKEDYLVFMGRPIPSKGWAWVQILASQGHTIKVAGAQKVSGLNIDWVGYVDGKEKAELLGRAKALLSPTMYLEPFGGVVAEAALCGTPAVTSDWGVYHETIEDGKTGFRVTNFTQFSGAVENVGNLDPQYIHDRAVALWSLDAVGKQYDTYFKTIAR